MIAGIGCDVVNMERLNKSLEFLERFGARILGQDEQKELMQGKNTNKEKFAASLAKRLADISAKSLKIIVISQLAYNILEILFMEGLRNISISLYLPLAPLAVSLCMLLFAGYIGRGRAYRDENERFI